MASGRRKKAKLRAEDRLSNLPEQLIHHILSFMDTKFAVQTCVLSTRWKSLWTSLPILVFNSNTFRTLKSFDKFVSHVLSGIRSRSAAADSSSSGVCVSGFDFTRGSNLSPALLKKVVKFVESQRVQSLSISIYYCKQPGFLSNIFRLKSLKHLKLTIDSHFEGLEDFFLNLPALTTLHLEKVSFSKFHSTRFFSDCLNLKKLTLVYTLGLEVFNISLPQLESLTVLRGSLEDSFLNLPALTTLHLEKVSFCKFHSRRFFSYFLNLKKLTLVDCYTLGLEVFNISLPQLESLTISLTLKRFAALQLNAQSLPSLEKVELDIWVPYYENTNQLLASQFINFLAELSRTKSLTLSLASIKILSAHPNLLKHQPSPFINLKFLKLNLHPTSIVPKRVMTYLVGCSPGVKVVKDIS